jgi:hypothetical protein
MQHTDFSAVVQRNYLPIAVSRIVTLNVVAQVQME